jgi:DNA-binding PadR family transcriptional regulator
MERPSEWRYGYDISRQTGLKSGTLYPLLMRLSEQGLLEDAWQEAQQPGRPPRHVYRLTSDGLDIARETVRPAGGQKVQGRHVEAGA